jgi:hypothetical protein
MLIYRRVVLTLKHGNNVSVDWVYLLAFVPVNFIGSGKTFGIIQIAFPNCSTEDRSGAAVERQIVAHFSSHATIFFLFSLLLSILTGCRMILSMLLQAVVAAAYISVVGIVGGGKSRFPMSSIAD